jgi:hypothetical protein
MAFAAVHESQFGTKLQVEPKTNEGRFWSEPDVGEYHCVAVAA